MRPFFVAATIAAAISTAGAQSGDKPQQPSFRSLASYVRVDVYPTTAGRPVLDLRSEEFELFEDGAPQKIDAFQHISVNAGGPQTDRPEPGSVNAVTAALADAHGRVFVLFLDTGNVTSLGSGKIAEPLIRMLDRLVGPDDLIGVMTAEMNPSQLVLGRKTEVIDRSLRSNPVWGRRFDKTRFDEREQLYDQCYPPLRQERINGRVLSELAQMLIDRRRERMTLDTLNALVRYLATVSEVRKTILTLTEGWMLYQTEQALLEPRRHPGDEAAPGQPPKTDPLPGPPGIGVKNGRLTSRDSDNPATALYTCEGDRMRLAMLDDEKYLKEITGNANRANASFYAIDPRGLPVFNLDISVDRPSAENDPFTYDRKTLVTSQNSMRQLALETDGFAVLNSNDLDRGLTRIVDDMTSYYLLGYYSTNTKLDGKFREIKVRTKRPGVEIRARRGYRAATAEEVKAATSGTAPPAPDPVATVKAALAGLANLESASRFRINAVTMPAASTMWVAGELRQTTLPDEWSNGGTVTIDVSVAGKSTTTDVSLPAGQRGFVASVTLPEMAISASIEIKVKLTGASGILTDSLQLQADAPLRPLLFRRGPSTGNRMQPATDFQLNRTERVRFEIPLPAGAHPAAGRLLDRTAQPLAIPLTVTERTDDTTGQRWLTADITLAALGIGDYAVELAMTRPEGEQRIVTAIRVTR